MTCPVGQVTGLLYLSDSVMYLSRTSGQPLMSSPAKSVIASQSSMARFDDGEDGRPTSADLTENDIRVLQPDNPSQSRPNTTGRMPSKLSRVMFSRSSYMSNNDYSSDSDVESDQFLITELKQVDDDLWKAVDASKRKSVHINSAFGEEEEDDGYWDTDLEIEDEQEEHDPTGRVQYAAACERLGVVPASYFTRHIEDPEVIMRYHGLGPLGAKAIAKVLRSNFTMERLNLSGNWIEGEGGMYMARMLLENDNFTHIDLSENCLGAEGAHHISKMLLVNVSLKTLNLSANELCDDSAGCLAEAMDQNKCLKELYLGRNKYDVVGGEILGPAICANDVLDHLDLSWNMIRRSGAVAVAKGIKENVRLKSCDVSWNGFGPQGGAAIAEAIATNESLQELDISGNRLDVESAILIGKALKRNEELKVLRMGNNPITTAGCVAIATAIHESDTCILTTLDLKEIPVEFEFLKLVTEIKKKREFEVIHGSVLRSGNTATDIGKPAINPTANKDPLLILREHIVVNDTRIFDILKRFDEGETYSVQPEQFAAALQELNVPISSDQLDNITKKLDKNADGKIYYGDMLNQLEAAGGTSFNQNISSDSSMSNSQQMAPVNGDGPPMAKLKLAQRDS